MSFANVHARGALMHFHAVWRPLKSAGHVFRRSGYQSQHQMNSLLTAMYVRQIFVHSSRAANNAVNGLFRRLGASGRTSRPRKTRARGRFSAFATLYTTACPTRTRGACCFACNSVLGDAHLEDVLRQALAAFLLDPPPWMQLPHIDDPKEIVAAQEVLETDSRHNTMLGRDVKMGWGK